VRPDGKRLGRLGHTWEDNIKIEHKEIKYVVMDCIHVVQNNHEQE
jgi:hypothetical protein